MLRNRKYIYKIFYNDQIYFYFDNQQGESLNNFPNGAIIKSSLLIIILNPENKNVISINFYFSFTRSLFFNNEFIINTIDRLALQKRKKR